MTVALILPLAIGCEVGLAGRGKWELTWYLSVLAPIANPLVGREGIVVVKKEGCVHVMGHVDLIITLEPVLILSYLLSGCVMVSISSDAAHRWPS